MAYGNQRITPIESRLSAADLGKFSMDGLDKYSDGQVETLFRKVGIGISENVSERAMDEYIAMNTEATISTWVQFLQAFYPTPIMIATKARRADRIGGSNKLGEWRDAEAVFPIVERIGKPRIYSDSANVPLASWNPSFEKRSIVAFELGLSVGKREEARAAAMRLNSASLKRSSVSEALALALNDVYFSGYQGNTYGLLNDPNLDAYVTVATGAGSDTEWSTKTFDEIVADINAGFSALAGNTGGYIDSLSARIKLVLPTKVLGALNTPNSYGMSVMEYLRKTYSNLEIIAIDNFNGANGGENVFYMILDEDLNGSFVQGQFIQDRFRLVGMQPTAKGFIEDYSNATAGCVVAQPKAIYRASGI